jgi:hypothetical protein
MSTSAQPPSDQELREAYEREIKKIRVEHVLLDNVVTLINLGMRRTGVVAGTEAERDPAQVKLAIDAVRAHVPLIEQVVPEQASALRDALSQLQLAYVKLSGQPEHAPAGPGSPSAQTSEKGSDAAAEPPAPEAAKPGEPGPAQSSGRLWVPGR